MSPHDPLRSVVTDRLAGTQTRPRRVSTPLFRQMHLPQERLVAPIIREVLERGMTHEHDQVGVLLFVRTVEPLKCHIVIASICIRHCYPEWNVIFLAEGFQRFISFGVT